MEAAAAIEINFLVGSMMLEFAKRLGPIPLDVDGVSRIAETYDEMERIRTHISEVLLNSNTEQKVTEECQCKKTI